MLHYFLEGIWPWPPSTGATGIPVTHISMCPVLGGSNWSNPFFVPGGFWRQMTSPDSLVPVRVKRDGYSPGFPQSAALALLGPSQLAQPQPSLHSTWGPAQTRHIWKHPWFEVYMLITTVLGGFIFTPGHGSQGPRSSGWQLSLNWPMSRAQGPGFTGPEESQEQDGICRSPSHPGPGTAQTEPAGNAGLRLDSEWMSPCTPNCRLSCIPCPK
uniref:uncharacterized protein LOC129519549 isoform X2 n=1 Tax=Nyctereutes procyonoides TaxID=34880 RepID=UPI002444D858|nr:uncharacterized protein LOC129519549 isoform X2 [Nyctereutes procyonoides]